MRNYFNIILVFILIYFSYHSAKAQTIYHDLEKNTVYDFLDEMANLQLIELNTLIQPYSRAIIAKKLNSINRTNLNNRQIKELDFFLRDFNKEILKTSFENKRKDLFYYSDSLFDFTFNPILGGELLYNENGTVIKRRNGAEFFGSVQRKWGFYFSLHDNGLNRKLQEETYLNTDPGFNPKSSGDYSTLRAGLTYEWNWGSIGLIKDTYTWGNHHFGANIISNKAPSFARVELKINPTKWLDFTYYHGWLASEIRDSSRSYIAGAKARNVDIKKFIAANVVTFTPIKFLKFSVGNSIVYSDDLQPAFFIPFAFFKTLDHSIYAGSGNYGGQNTQIFLDISSRNFKKVHLYSTIFVDEISFSRFWDEEQHSNFLSMKFGAQWSNILNKNLQLTVEYTKTNPITYNHFVNTTTYASNNYNMGHYLRDNAQEIALELGVKPIAKLNILTGFIYAEKGTVYPYSGLTNHQDVWGLPFIDETRWIQKRAYLMANYEIMNDLKLSLSYLYNQQSGKDLELYTSPYFQKETSTLSTQLSIGF